MSILGVNVHTDGPGATEAIAAVPKGSWIRDDFGFEHFTRGPNAPNDPALIRQKLAALKVAGGPIVAVVIPAMLEFEWRRPNRAFGEDQIEPIAAKFAEFVDALKREAKAQGVAESRLLIHLGNEAGAGHPGGLDGDAPHGLWWERNGRLLEACLKRARFGRIRVVLPATSFLECPDARRPTELYTAEPILRRLASLGIADLCSTHSRTYAPWLSAGAYAREAVRAADERSDLVTSWTGLPCLIPEFYVSRFDTPDQGAALERIAANPPKAGTLVYKIGEGGEFSLPTRAAVSAVASGQ